MAERSAISWTDHSFAPWHGCTKVSVGPQGACANCYAENIDVHRFHKVVGFGPGVPRVRAPDSTWDQVRAWNRAAAKAGERRLIFCSHLSDLFDKEVDPTWRADVFLLAHETPSLIWLPLTKRPQNILKMLPALWPKNAAIGFTAVTQREFDRDFPHALAAFRALGAAFLFVSYEPAMGALVLPPEFLALGSRAWVIAGGEKDQGKARARPSNPDWFRAVRDQCAAAGVPFHFKQWGSWLPGQNEQHPNIPSRCFTRFQDRTDPSPASGFGPRHPTKAVKARGDYRLFGAFPYGPGTGFFTQRVGAAKAGRHLDGVLHDARPVVP